MICVVVLPLVFLLVRVAVRFGGSPHQRSSLWSSYECGFLAQSQGHRRFSLFFFQICLLFIVLDAEILILMPIPEIRDIGAVAIAMLMGFLVILTGGLYHEWREGALRWAYS